MTPRANVYPIEDYSQHPEKCLPPIQCSGQAEECLAAWDDPHYGECYASMPPAEQAENLRIHNAVRQLEALGDQILEAHPGYVQLREFLQI